MRFSWLVIIAMLSTALAVSSELPLPNRPAPADRKFNSTIIE